MKTIKFLKKCNSKSEAQKFASVKRKEYKLKCSSDFTLKIMKGYEVNNIKMRKELGGVAPDDFVVVAFFENIKGFAKTDINTKELVECKVVKMDDVKNEIVEGDPSVSVSEVNASAFKGQCKTKCKIVSIYSHKYLGADKISFRTKGSGKVLQAFLLSAREVIEFYSRLMNFRA